MPPTHRKVPALLGGLLLVTAVLVATAVSTPRSAPATRPVAARGCLGYCTHPTNAGKVFRWGYAHWDQEFVTPLSHWRSNRHHALSLRHGMLTIWAGRHSGTVKAWPTNQAARTGRWEARVRAVNRGGSGSRYHLTWELVPAGGDDRCGANAIVMAKYKAGDRRVTGSVRTLPHTSFTYSRARDLRSRAWHTYAVEITKRHISWFVDTRVVRTERRPAARSGLRYRPQLVLQARHGKPMRAAWIQADWLRYYTLQRHNARSIKAPKMHKTTYLHGC